MSLRIPLFSCLRTVKPSQPTRFIIPLRSFTSSTIARAKQDRQPGDKKRISNDPYLVAQREAKKAALRSRNQELQEVRIASLGNPVRGVSTPFIQSFETSKPVEHVSSRPVPKDEVHLNYAFDTNTVDRQLLKSERWAVPLDHLEKPTIISTYSYKDQRVGGITTSEVQKTSKEVAERVKNDHARATEAIRRITALENGSSKDRMRANIARCLGMFGRHNTDLIMPPRAPTMRVVDGVEVHPPRPETNAAAAEKRIGPDTGSSEVQIAILTAKIKALADFLDTRGKGDKQNKRNLRLLVHKRQKLLQYLRRKERGGPRWQHCIETLGLTEGTWQGEISL